MAIVHSNHPETRLSKETALKIKLELGRRAIRITSCHSENGAVVVGCANTHTKSWLETQFKQLDRFEGFQLRLGPARSLVRICKVTTFIPRTTGAETKDDVMLGLKSQTATATLCQKILADDIGVVLIQEPWTVKGRVMGMSTLKGKLIYDTQCDKPRACVFVNNNIKALKITDLCSRDTAVTEVHLQTGGGSIRILFASVYLPYGSVEAPPTTAMRRTVEYGVNRRKHLILGLDANAHHVTWGSTNTNRRGEYLMNYIIESNLSLINQGRKPTFQQRRGNILREEVLDITLASCFAAGKIREWGVLDDHSASDHNYISFHLKSTCVKGTYRNPRRTDWEKFRKESIKRTNKNSCWWNRKLETQRRNIRRLYNQCKRTGNWDSYAKALTEYSKAVKEAKRNFCQDIESVPDCAKLQRVLARNPTSAMETVLKEDGSHTEDAEETLAILLSTHFPGSTESQTVDIRENRVEREVPRSRASRDKWDCAKSVVTYGAVTWAFESFEPFKAPGADGIIPVMLQQSVDIIAPKLMRLFRLSLATGVIPSPWEISKVVFIPKPCKPSYDVAKAYRPISLMSFLLKTMEKVIDRHIGLRLWGISPYILTNTPIKVGSPAKQPFTI
nr:unnamed protein product [Callosobruchus analis]